MLAKVRELTVREREVLMLIGQGKRSKQIALHLGRSVRTVHGHVAAISRKLGSASRAEMVRIALLSGVATAPPETPQPPDRPTVAPSATRTRAIPTPPAAG